MLPRALSISGNCHYREIRILYQTATDKNVTNTFKKSKLLVLLSTRDDYSELACGINGWCLLSRTSNLDFLNVLVTFLSVAVW